MTPGVDVVPNENQGWEMGTIKGASCRPEPAPRRGAVRSPRAGASTGSDHLRADLTLWIEFEPVPAR